MSATLAATVGARAPVRRAGLRWVLRQLAAKRSAQIGGAIIAVLVICAAFAPWIAPQDPYRVDVLNRMLPASSAHWFGTDEVGRDLFSRIVYGSRYFFLICVASVLIKAAIGITLGLVAGAGPSWADMLVMRVVDVLLAFPYILLVLAIIAILGPSLWTAIVAVGIAGSSAYARIVRSEVLAVRQEEYVEAMRALGAGPWRIALGTVLPNVASTLIVYTTFAMPLAVLSAAALSFLGLGAQPPTPEWGAMVVGARTLLSTAWWVAAAPACAIFLAILSLNLIGNALRDVLDPRSQ
jgi:peptide/nickel transport system permease protein